MEKLKQTKKITTATLKSFAKRNSDKLFIKNLSSFCGMTDCVENVDGDWTKTEIIKETNYYKTGIKGLYTVGRSNDYFLRFEDANYIGIEVYNSCGSAIIGIKK